MASSRRGVTNSHADGKPAFALVERFFGTLFCERPGEQVALAIVAAKILEQCELRLGLDTFRDDLFLKSLGERDYRLQYLGVFPAFADAVNERAVDLQRVERQTM